MQHVGYYVHGRCLEVRGSLRRGWHKSEVVQTFCVRKDEEVEIKKVLELKTGGQKKRGRQVK